MKTSSKGSPVRNFLPAKSLLFVFAALLQVAAALFIAGRYYWVETTGETVLVKATGYDPNDPFRGDFANVSYGDLVSWNGEVPFSPATGKRVYVTPEMTSSGEFVAVKSVSDSRPEGRYFQAKVASYSFDHPRYGYELDKTSSAKLEPGTFVAEDEWVSSYGLESASSPEPQTQF